MAVSIINPKFYAWDNDTGKPMAFGKVYTYQAGTNTPKATFKSETGVTENTNPVILNGAGYADIYLDGSYKVVVKDADDVEVWTANPVTDPSGLQREWINERTATQVSPTSFEMVGNYTDLYTPGKALQLDDTTYLYGHVESVQYLSGNTVVEVASEDPLTSDLTRAWTGILSDKSVPNKAAKGVIRVGGVSEIANYDVPAGYVFSLNDGGRSGTFDVIAGAAPVSDPSNAIYINLVNGNHAKRRYSGPVNVKWYGAVGDGSTNDAPAIQTAIDSNRHTYFPQGSYFVGTSINVPTRITIEGQGEREQSGGIVTILSNRTALGEGGVIFSHNATSRQSIVIKNIKFVGDSDITYNDLENADSEGVIGIDPGGIKQGFRLKNVGFTDLKCAIKRVKTAGYIGHTTLDACTFNTNYSCIEFSTTTGISINDTVFYDNYTVGETGKVLGNNVSFNNSSYASEASQLKFTSGIFNQVWLEGYNRTLYPTEFLQVNGGYFSESMSSDGSTKYSIDILNDNVTVELNGVRLPTNTRLFNMRPTDEESIFVSIKGCRNANNFAQLASITNWYNIPILGINNDNPAYNVDTTNNQKRVRNFSSLNETLVRAERKDPQVNYVESLVDGKFTKSYLMRRDAIEEIVLTNDYGDNAVMFVGEIIVFNIGAGSGYAERRYTKYSLVWTAEFTSKSGRVATLTQIENIVDDQSGGQNIITSTDVTAVASIDTTEDRNICTLTFDITGSNLSYGYSTVYLEGYFQYMA